MIFAVSSGRAPSAISVIRISGAGVDAIATAFGAGAAVTAPRRMSLARLCDPVSKALLDTALAVFFPSPNTATGEDLLEWHCHGGIATIAAVLAALERVNGTRPAEPGEFTRRALENGRIDLNEAEGLADLLQAQTEAQRRAAVSMAEGHFSARVDTWRRQLLGLAAQIEALLDFSDEDDVASGSVLPETLLEGFAALRVELDACLMLPSAERLHEGVRVVIAGPPNAGKSTLLNALVGREAAIVTDIAGTTRDRIDVPVRLGGMVFQFIDTAGLRDDTADAVEAIGIDRTYTAIAQADLVMWLGAPDAAPQEIDAELWKISPQCDAQLANPAADMAISAKTGEGMEALIDALIAFAARLVQPEAEFALHDRQRRCMAAVSDAIANAEGAGDPLIAAEELRIALRALDQLTGRAGVEDMLDALFGRFCIGK